MQAEHSFTLAVIFILKIKEMILWKDTLNILENPKWTGIMKN